MRKLLVLALVLGLAGYAVAADLGNHAPVKANPVVPQNVPNPALQGGDTVLNAMVIPALPYSDSGTTAGYNDDYDEVCPYTNSTSPDVVYSFTAGATAQVNIDLCGSAYDTKLYVYDSGLSLVACNDDFYFGEPCGTYVSKLENVTLQAGGTYYIIIDGYGGASGAYVLTVEGFVPCVVECPVDGVAEGEPELVPDYEDLYNGGCNTDGVFPFQTLVGDENGDLVLCGVSGWYSYAGSQYRDTDWFILTAGANGSIEISADAEIATYLFELGPQDCASVGVLQQVTVGPCAEGFMTIPAAPLSTVWFWVGPTVFAPPAGGESTYDYVVNFSGLEIGVATEGTTWGTLKALYE